MFIRSTTWKGAAVTLAAALPIALAGSAFGTETLLTFEEAVGNDVAPISTFYAGIIFTADSSGSEWVFRDCSTGFYNVSSWPSGAILGGGGEYWIYGFGAATTALDDTGNNGRITFESGNATYVEIGYSFNDFSGQGNMLTLTAYDENDNPLDVDAGPSNLRFIHANADGPGTLRVEAPAGQFIKYVIVSDTGNFWIIDNLRTDATDITILTGACCLDNSCTIVDEGTCFSLGGEYLGDGTECDACDADEPDAGCTYGQGYWRNHPGEWPVDELTLGSVTYSQAQLLAILQMPVRSNGAVILAKQLIAALLNQENGAASTPEIDDAIDGAHALLGSMMIPPVGNGYLPPSLVGMYNALLDAYNNGDAPGGPPHCDE